MSQFKPMSTMQVLDGNAAAAYIAHATNEVIAVYPITPSSTIGEIAHEKSQHGETNIWGQVPCVSELQSEAGAVAAVHGALAGGSLATTFTASQGLLLMLPNLYKIAGELTPAVFYVTARTIASHALSIFCDHSDVMAARSTGFAQFFASNVQEVMDFSLVAQNATFASRVPFLLIFDGFRTSHELNKISVIDFATIRQFIDPAPILAHRQRRLTPDKPTIKGTAQNPDVFFQGREAANPYYAATPALIQRDLDRLAQLTGRSYRLYEYVGDPKATRIIVAMGSACETIHEAVNKLNQAGAAVGVVKVRLYRPFALNEFVAEFPASTQAIAVLDRTKEPGSLGEPLYLDVRSAVWEAVENQAAPFSELPLIIGGRYGLSSKEFTPAMVQAVFENLAAPRSERKNHFVVGINDDVSGLSLNYDPSFTSANLANFRGIFFGMGADGTVGANKNSIKIIGELSELYVQGFFEYDSKKSGSYTISHLRFGHNPIQSSYLIQTANFVACHSFGFLFKYDVLEHAEQGGTFLLASPYSATTVWEHLPRLVQEQIIQRQLKFYIVNAQDLAQACGLGKRINTIMQTAFFAISQVLPEEVFIPAIRATVKKTYARKGQQVVANNLAAIEQTLAALHAVVVPDFVSSQLEQENQVSPTAPAFVQTIVAPMLRLQGDRLPVSALPVDGTWPSGTSQFEKRNISSKIPVWDSALCTQCGLCTLVCPHAAIRMKVAPVDDLVAAPATLKHIPAKIKGFSGKEYLLQVAPEDCTGCDACVDVCPVRLRNSQGEFTNHKALNMQPQVDLLAAERENFSFFSQLGETNDYEVPGGIVNLKGSQLMQPLFEFSGACSGCGETPYIKLLTQLVGDRLMIANATGCSSIFGGNLPTTPYTTNPAGRGPSWANSLFEDNAEFALGMRLSSEQLAGRARLELLQLVQNQLLPEQHELIQSILNAASESATEIYEQRERLQLLHSALREADLAELASLNEILDQILLKSVWAIGGDGWAYDIGYGGLDHVIASGSRVKILVLDTECYSNTGGQMSKATSLGAMAKFALQGKENFKKDLGLLAMTYGHVYVAQIAMNASPVQSIRALSEAEAYAGPAIVIAYSQCISHGFANNSGMEQQKKAVQSGYWLLYRFNPSLKLAGKNPLQLDSREPNLPLAEYYRSETRFDGINELDAERAADFLRREQAHVLERYHDYAYRAQMPLWSSAASTDTDAN